MTTLMPPRPSVRRGATAQRHQDRRSRRLRLVRWVAAVVGLAVLGVGGWIVAFSSVLVAERVDVEGVRLLPADQVRAAADIPLGVPLARQDVEAIAGRVAVLPAVESVRVSRRWPHTVAVEVTERTPVVTIGQAGHYLLVDDQGVVFHAAAERTDGPLLADVDPTDPDLVVAVSGVAAALPEDFRARVVRVSARSTAALTFRLRSGTEVRWGDTSDPVLKAQVTTALVRQKPRPGVIDVSAPASPSIR